MRGGFSVIQYRRGQDFSFIGTILTQAARGFSLEHPQGVGIVGTVWIVGIVGI